MVSMNGHNRSARFGAIFISGLRWALITGLAVSVVACGGAESVPLAEQGPRREEAQELPGATEDDGGDFDDATLAAAGENASARVCRFQGRDLSPGFSSDYYSFCVDAIDARLSRENLRLLTNSRGETVELARLDMTAKPESPTEPSVHALIRVRSRDGQVLKEQVFDRVVARAGERTDREVATLSFGEGGTIRLKIACAAVARCAGKR